MSSNFLLLNFILLSDAHLYILMRSFCTSTQLDSLLISANIRVSSAIEVADAKSRQSSISAIRIRNSEVQNRVKNREK